MALEQKLSLKMQQKLVMTPSLQQAIKLLQMTRMELEETLTQELVENPVLEDNTEVVEQQSEEERRAEEKASADSDSDSGDGDADPEELRGDSDDPMDNIDFEAYFNDQYESYSGSYASTREDRDDIPFAANLTRQPDLYDHLLWQLHALDVSQRQRQLAEMIIGNLDEEGFLQATVDEVVDLAMSASENGGEVDREALLCEVEEALTLVRGFDPPGVAQSDLRSSLLAQMRDRGISEEALCWCLVEDHWERFLRRQYPAIAKELGVDLADLEPAVEEIKTLDTRPGRAFASDRPHYIEPDVVINKVSGEYVIQLNDDGLPRLRVSRAYRRMLQKMRQAGDQAEAQQFIKDKMRSAMWLIKSLDQRQRTIYKVANSIMKQQRDFFDRGIEHLKPMVLRDVAEDIEMHESTVSRVVSNKYMHTPRGLFPLKFFFHSGIDREYGENISSLTVKRKLERLIADEDGKRPLSDSELMRILNREGIQIARRTVAKYRDELGIPSSTDRKQIF